LELINVNRNAAMLFEPEMARRNCHLTMPSLFGFVGMMEWDPKFIYGLLPLTLGDTDSESRFERSSHLVRECNMLHLSKNGVAAAGGKEDDAYPILRTPRE
jgi:hypothetical protein